MERAHWIFFQVVESCLDEKKLGKQMVKIPWRQTIDSCSTSKVRYEMKRLERSLSMELPLYGWPFASSNPTTRAASAFFSAKRMRSFSGPSRRVYD
jgi:hypothetical protein